MSEHIRWSSEIWSNLLKVQPPEILPIYSEVKMPYTVKSPPQQQPDDFLATSKTLGRLLRYVFKY